MKKQSLVKQYKETLNGQEVVVNQFKSKEKKGKSYGRSITTNCPCCGSKLQLNDSDLWYCTGDKLLFWQTEFNKYTLMSDKDKVTYISNISTDSQFFELYDRWKYAKEVGIAEEFNCGYTNNIFLPIANTRTIIPDPLFVKKLEEKLKRPLTDEELLNESPIYVKAKRVSKQWFKGSKEVTIPYVVLPDETGFYPKTED